jgi:hypothetical protein
LTGPLFFIFGIETQRFFVPQTQERRRLPLMNPSSVYILHLNCCRLPLIYKSLVMQHTGYTLSIVYIKSSYLMSFLQPQVS